MESNKPEPTDERPPIEYFEDLVDTIDMYLRHDDRETAERVAAALWSREGGVPDTVTPQLGYYARAAMASFVSDRIEQMPDRDHARTLSKRWSAAMEWVDVSTPNQDHKVPGDVKDVRAMFALARIWHEHPTYRSEWR